MINIFKLLQITIDTHIPMHYDFIIWSKVFSLIFYSPLQVKMARHSSNERFLLIVGMYACVYVCEFFPFFIKIFWNRLISLPFRSLFEFYWFPFIYFSLFFSLLSSFRLVLGFSSFSWKLCYYYSPYSCVNFFIFYWFLLLSLSLNYSFSPRQSFV